MVKVLFVVHNMREGDVDTSFPLGVGYLAAVLEAEGAHVEVLDLDAMGIRDPNAELLIHTITDRKPDFVCVGFTCPRYVWMKHTLWAIREACNECGAAMVIGGHGPSAIPVYMRSETGADAVICGEAEEAIKDVVFNVERGVLLGRKVQKLDNIPFPAWHLFNMEAYTNKRTRLFTYGHEEKPMFFMITSRGCAGRCSFCYRLTPKIRQRSIANVREEIMALHDKYGIEFFFLFDEMAVGSKARATKLCKMFNDLPFDFKWASNCRVEPLQDLDTVKMLVDSGCINMGVGFESMDDVVLKKMNKRTTAKQNIIAADNCVKAGLNMTINVLWALPGDTAESLEKNVQFVLEYSSWNECRTIKPATPYPGSPLYDLAIETGKLANAEDFFEKHINLDLITVNYMDMPIHRAYKLLYDANARLIDAYFENATEPEMSYGDAEEQKKGFHDLYFKKDTTFRGVR